MAAPLLLRPTISGDVGASTAGLPEEATALALALRERASEAADAAAATEKRRRRRSGGEEAIAPVPHGTRMTQRILPSAEEGGGRLVDAWREKKTERMQAATERKVRKRLKKNSSSFISAFTAAAALSLSLFPLFGLLRHSLPEARGINLPRRGAVD